jgi:hypothetical protein
MIKVTFKKIKAKAAHKPVYIHRLLRQVFMENPFGEPKKAA